MSPTTFAAALVLAGLAAPLAAHSLAPADVRRLAGAILAANPDLAGVALGLAQPGSRDIAIVADSDGSYGTRLTAEDRELVDLDDTLIRPEPAGASRMMAVHAALHNRAGRPAGFVRLAFRRDLWTDPLKVHARAAVLLAELAKMAGDLPGLPPARPDAPAPAGPPAHWGRAADNPIFAQTLVNRIMAENPNLVSVGLHAVPAGRHDQQIIAQSRDLMGKPDSASDLAVTQWDGIRFEPEVKNGQSWLAVLTRIRSRDGRSFGMVVLAFRPGPGVTKLSAHVAAQVIFDELRQALPDEAALFAPSDPALGSQDSSELLPYRM